MRKSESGDGFPPPVKVAVTVWSPLLMSTLQPPVPEQAPPQPPNVAPAAGSAVRVTTALESYLPWQALGQEICVVLSVTVPGPDTFTVSSGAAAGAAAAKVAVTVWSPLLMSTAHVEPEQAPLHSLKVAPGSGVAVSPTTVFASYVPVQALGQAICCVSSATVPGPLTTTVSVGSDADRELPAEPARRPKHATTTQVQASRRRNGFISNERTSAHPRASAKADQEAGR